MGYVSWKEDEAFREGKRDAEYGRNNCQYDRHFGGDVDKAYFDGVREQEREEERRREMYDEMRREEEMQARRQEDHLRYMRDMGEQEYDMQQEDDRQQEEDMQQDERKWYHNSDDLPF